MNSIKRRGYITIIESSQDNYRVAQVIDFTSDKSIYAVYVNYNGSFRIINANHIRTATEEERKNDPKIYIT